MSRIKPTAEFDPTQAYGRYVEIPRREWNYQFLRYVNNELSFEMKETIPEQLRGNVKWITREPEVSRYNPGVITGLIAWEYTPPKGLTA